MPLNTWSVIGWRMRNAQLVYYPQQNTMNSVLFSSHEPAETLSGRSERLWECQTRDQIMRVTLQFPQRGELYILIRNRIFFHQNHRTKSHTHTNPWMARLRPKYSKWTVLYKFSIRQGWMENTLSRYNISSSSIRNILFLLEWQGWGNAREMVYFMKCFQSRNIVFYFIVGIYSLYL